MTAGPSHSSAPEQNRFDHHKGERSITADTALRLARWMNTTPEYWLNLQRNYDLKVAQMEIGERITEEITPLQRVVS